MWIVSCIKVCDTIVEETLLELTGNSCKLCLTVIRYTSYKIRGKLSLELVQNVAVAVFTYVLEELIGSLSCF